MASLSAFSRRHIGPSDIETHQMVQVLGCGSLDELMNHVVPEGIRASEPLDLPEALTEEQALATLKSVMGQNRVLRSFIGMGYHDTFTPPVIQRNIFENPGWYTAYTPYQAEIAQGRLEALLNYQTMICDLTGLDVANASLLDEGTAVAEAIAMAVAQHGAAKRVFVSDMCHPQTIDVVQTRMEPLGIKVEVGDVMCWDPEETRDLAAVVVQYPDTLGIIRDFKDLAPAVHEAGALFIVAADLLALTLITPPGDFGADICVGNSQRFGVPLGFGGPHAAFMAVKDALKRRMPGRLVGISVDAQGRPAYRLSLQTREQHIRREKATSNICTAQVLLAVMASMYAVYHGPEGLKAIARRTQAAASWLADELAAAGLDLAGDDFFDTVTVQVEDAEAVLAKALEQGINLGCADEHTVIIALDERVTEEELHAVLAAFDLTPTAPFEPEAEDLIAESGHSRTSDFLKNEVFHRYHSETEMMRYLHRLEAKDIALNRSMIPLGSCTMKLNAVAEMMPVSWPEVGAIHPFAPADQCEGYREMFASLEASLAEITGFAAVSLQPNAGSQGEQAGLLAIRRYHASRNEGHRDVCLIPVSAHGTNPASAVMSGFKVVAVKCDDHGNISIDDLREQLAKHSASVAALMVTYPSTHGEFEEGIVEICRLVHKHGAQVYMDGANMNAQVGLTSPGRIGADVCHLNLHKTFCIPHGGGGPGVGPIGVAEHLVPFLPGHIVFDEEHRSGAVCSAPWGSASITVISWMYITMMGAAGLTDATKMAILNANYIAKRLGKCFPVLFSGKSGHVAHECILDFRQFKKVTVEDVAKRLMDYGYHAPTMSWPVGGTLMIEPTESESKAELDRFCEAMEAIHAEILRVEDGTLDALVNPLKQAPHTADVLLAPDWQRGYSREEAAFPLGWVKENKYWPPVGRIDNVQGDRHLVCTCVSVEEASS